MAKRYLSSLVSTFPGHRVRVHVVIDGDEGTVRKVEAVEGPLPDVSGIVGAPFRSRSLLNAEIRRRMEAIQPLPPRLSTVTVQVPAGREGEIEELARLMREGSTTTTTRTNPCPRPATSSTPT